MAAKALSAPKDSSSRDESFQETMMDAEDSKRDAGGGDWGETRDTGNRKQKASCSNVASGNG